MSVLYCNSFILLVEFFRNLIGNFARPIVKWMFGLGFIFELLYGIPESMGIAYNYYQAVFGKRLQFTRLNQAFFV